MYYWSDRFTTPNLSRENNLKVLSIPRSLISNGIPCVVWGDYALNLVHHVPTGVSVVHLLVKDDQVRTATEFLLSNYRCFPGSPCRSWSMYSNDPNRNCLPDAACLEFPEGFPLTTEALTGVSEKLALIPMSNFHFDLNNTHSLFKAQEYPGVLFPTIPAFVDAIIDSEFEPHLAGEKNITAFSDILSTWMNYIQAYSLDDPIYKHIPRGEDGYDDDDDLNKCIIMDDLTPAALKLLGSIKKENRFYLEMDLLEQPWPPFEVLREYRR